MSSTIEQTEDESAEKVQAAVDKALNKQARAAEVDTLKYGRNFEPDLWTKL